MSNADKCREEFEKYLDDNKMFMNINRVFNQSSNEYEYCAIQWIWGSWQHQQAKVEELQKRINDSIFILSTIDTPDEAYKLIDSLLITLRGEQALKGDKS